MHPTTSERSPAQGSARTATRKPGLLINRDYGLLWSGQAISIIGDFAFMTTLAVWVYTLVAGQPWAPLAVTGVYVVTALPMMLVGPLAGVFVDRADKRRMMLAMDALRAVLVAALILVTGVLPPGALSGLPYIGGTIAAALPGGQFPLEWRLGAIYGVVFVVMCAEQFFRPAMTALVGDLVADEYRGRAMGLGQGSVSVAMLLGTLFAPPLVVSFGAQWTLAFNAFTFVVSYLTILAVRAPKAARSVERGERGHFLRELASGMRFYARSAVLRTLLIAGVVIMVGAGAINSLDIFFVTGNLHTDLQLYGVLSAVMGVGMIAGSILAALFAQRLGYARSVWLTLLVMGGLITVYSRLTSFGPAVALMGVLGVFQAGLNVAVGPLMLSVTPRALIGRVSAILNPAMAVANLAGTAVAGYLAGTVLVGFSANAEGVAFGPIDTIFSGAGLIALLGATYCALALRTKTVERERVAEPAPEPASEVADAVRTGPIERELLAV
jgi:MFS family permease